MSPSIETFESNRQFLLGLAYRLLGRYTEAEDLVQETYLRWHAKTSDNIQNPRLYLSRILTNLCLDYMKSARVRREEYIGQWLPEPTLGSQVQPVFQNDGVMTFEDMPDLSYALMLSLERLSPLERAVFILHDVFSVSFSELAKMLERTEAACRQLASRARKNIRQEKKRFMPSQETLNRLLDVFVLAATSQDTAALTQLLAKDAVFCADGGGVVPAALLPLHGSDAIAQFFCRVYGNYSSPERLERHIILLNGEPALVSKDPNGILQVNWFAVDEVGLFNAFYVLRNPEKIKHLRLGEVLY